MKRYGEKTLREALENGAVLSIYDCPARGPILRVKKDNENLGWITFDLYLKIRLDLEVVKKGEYIKEYTLKSIVYADLRIGALTETTETETTETETTETAQQEEKVVCFHCGGECYGDRYPEIVFSGEGIHICEECSIDFEIVCGVPVPRFIWVLTYEKIGIVIEALKKAVAPLEKEMEENNVSRDRLAQLDKEVTKTWGEIGVLQYLQIVQGTGVNPSGRKFRDVEMGEIVTIDDVLYTWAAYKEIHEEHPHFPKYLGNCQTFKGGTLEEIR